MDKFKKAIEQLNKPIYDTKKPAQGIAEKTSTEKTKMVEPPKPKVKKTKTSEPPKPKVKKTKTSGTPKPELKELDKVELPKQEAKESETVETPKPEVKELDKVELPNQEAKESETVETPKPELKEPETVETPKPELKEQKTFVKQLNNDGDRTALEKELEEEYLSDNPETEFMKKAKKRAAKKEKKKEQKEADKKRKRERKEKRRNKSKERVAVDETPGKKKKSGLKQGIVSALIISIIVFALIGVAANIHLNNQLKPVFYQVQSNKVVDNVRIVAISDLHLKEFGENNIRLVNKIASYHPDIIAIVGDMNIDKNPDYSVVLNLCARLNNVAPLYYALGNHEFEAMLFEDSQIYYDLKAAGIKVLNNETEIVEVGLSTIDIVGLTQPPKSFRADGKKFFDAAMNADDNFKLVLTHYPEYFFGMFDEYTIDLAISGHAHGGQVRLPFIGGLYSADQGVLPKLCDGYHEIENSKLIVSKGLGSSGVVPRINNAPEITIVDINWY